MDFTDTPEEAAFRAELRAWLAANGQRRSRPDEVFGEGLDDTARLAAAKEWQAKKAAAGYPAITWPKEAGGRGGTAMQQVIYDQNGSDVKLSQFKGKVVVLDFWATWCAPCIASIPEFKDLWEKYRADDFILLSISADIGEKEWRDFIKAENMDWLHVFDPGEKTGPLEVYAIQYIPDTWIIDKNGIAISHGLRHGELDAAVRQALR